MRVATILVLTLFMLPLVQANSESSWSHQFEAGYISTQPLVVDDSVYVRISGFWTGEERPLVAAFELQTGNEIGRIPHKHRFSTIWRLSCLLKPAVERGVWNDLLLVGWTDGKLTALSPTNGTLVWQNQTEVDIIGLTGKMVLDGDQVIVPTRTGLSSFCLSDGTQLLDIDTGNIGWRNGVAMIEHGYAYGDENGYLHEVDRNGNVTSTFLGDGKIRHAPLDTRHGLFVHMQTAQGSTIYLNGTALANMGGSPAMPLAHNDRIYAATSDEWISLVCDEQSCAVDSVVPFRSNGELSIRIVESGIEIWAPSNTPDGGWGVFNQTSLVRMETTTVDTYGTAAPGFAQGVIALGNDAGILQLVSNRAMNLSQRPQKPTLLGYYISLLYSVCSCSHVSFLLCVTGNNLQK